MPKDSFATDLSIIRERARANMMDGAVTDSYLADREKVIAVLNEVLATELVCVLRYKNHYHTASGINSATVAAEFLEHATDEQAHADSVAHRITQLGGNPNFNPDGLHLRSHAEYGESKSIDEMLKQDLVAERIAIETYSEIVRWLGNDDPTTRSLMEDLLKVEEEHADDLANLLQRL
jgi:bacterioferritin